MPEHVMHVCEHLTQYQPTGGPPRGEGHLSDGTEETTDRRHGELIPMEGDRRRRAIGPGDSDV